MTISPHVSSLFIQWLDEMAADQAVPAQHQATARTIRKRLWEASNPQPVVILAEPVETL